MHDLIEALQIFSKYTSSRNPTHCEHDVMYVCVSPKKVSEDDKKRLNTLSFNPSLAWEGVFQSYRFGSA